MSYGIRVWSFLGTGWTKKHFFLFLFVLYPYFIEGLFIGVALLLCITMSMSKVLQIRMNSSDNNMLKEVADRNQRKVSDMARVIIKDFIKKRR